MRIRFALVRLAAAAVLSSALLAVSGCANGSVFLYDGSANAGNFTNTLVLGDSLAAGFQNGSLNANFQPNGWAPLLAAQAGFSGNFVQPLIASPGLPAYTTLNLASYAAGPPFAAELATTAGTSTGRSNSTVQVSDFAVPGALVRDLINAVPVASPINATTPQQMLNYAVLTTSGVGLSQVGWALKDNPTTIFLWVGNDDAMQADITCDPTKMTSVTNFQNQYQNLLLQLTSNINAHLVIANIPDVTQFPYMTPQATLTAAYATTTTSPYYTGKTQTQIATILGLNTGDLVNLPAVKNISAAAIIAGTQAAVPSTGKLTAAQVATVQATIASYNAAIAIYSATVGATTVDMKAYFANEQTTPPSYNNYQASFNYLGGLFSTDGYTPTNTFNALLANRIILALNNQNGLSIPSISYTSIKSIATNDPLFGANVGVKTF